MKSLPGRRRLPARRPCRAVAAATWRQAPPPAPYQAVSELVPLPDFLPGLGQLFVDPATLPAGPFLAYDHDGALVSTDLHDPGRGPEPRQDASTTSPRPAALSTTSTSTSTPAIPGVEKPHAHLVLWHVPAADEARVAE